MLTRHGDAKRPIIWAPPPKRLKLRFDIRNCRCSGKDSTHNQAICFPCPATKSFEKSTMSQRQHLQADQKFKAKPEIDVGAERGHVFVWCPCCEGWTAAACLGAARDAILPRIRERTKPKIKPGAKQLYATPIAELDTLYAADWRAIATGECVEEDLGGGQIFMREDGSLAWKQHCANCWHMWLGRANSGLTGFTFDGCTFAELRPRLMEEPVLLDFKGTQVHPIDGTPMENLLLRILVYTFLALISIQDAGRLKFEQYFTEHHGNFLNISERPDPLEGGNTYLLVRSAPEPDCGEGGVKVNMARG